MITLQNESTEYVFVGVTGDPPGVDQEIAFLEQPNRPGSEDWEEAVLVDDSQHALWGDAQASGATGDYFLARLVGSFGDNDVSLSPGLYQVWIRLTDTVERPVRIAPVALEIA